MKAKELRIKKVNELEKMLKEWREQLRHLRFKKVRKEIKDTSEQARLRRDIARILTVLRENNHE